LQPVGSIDELFEFGCAIDATTCDTAQGSPAAYICVDLYLCEDAVGTAHSK